MNRAPLGLALALLAAGSAFGSEVAKVPVETFELSNGMRFLAVVRPELATVSAGWVARVGSANERPGITGLSHFFEHMMFKGSRTIGTRDIDRDLRIVEEQEKLQEAMRAIYRRQRERYRLGEIGILSPMRPVRRSWWSSRGDSTPSPKSSVSSW